MVPAMTHGRSPRIRRIFIVHPSNLLTDSVGNGDGLLAYRYICELAKRGHHVTVACEAVKLVAPVPENVTIHRLELRSRPRSLARRIEYAFAMRRLFIRLGAARAFDVAHQLNPVEAGLSLGLIGSRVPLVLGPYVAHWPAGSAARFKRTFRDAIGRAQQQFADKILISGPSARARIVRKAFPPAAISTVPYGIDLETFSEAAFPAGDPVILYLAGFGPKKGLRILLAAFELLAARVPAVRLVVAGDGPEREQIEALAAASAYHERIRFTGSIARVDVPPILRSCTVFCLASFGEPYGMALVEAMATGRPVVATKLGGPIDLVEPGGGILVPPGDPQALASALETIVSDPALARRMGAFNRQAMMAYSWAAITDRLEAVYDDLIDRAPIVARKVS